MNKDAEQLLICVSAIFICYLVKRLFKSFVHPLLRLSSCENSPYIVELALYEMHYWKILSPRIYVCFTLKSNSISSQYLLKVKDLILILSNLSNFYFICFTSSIVSKKSLHNLRSCIFSVMFSSEVFRLLGFTFTIVIHFL